MLLSFIAFCVLGLFATNVASSSQCSSEVDDSYIMQTIIFKWKLTVNHDQIVPTVGYCPQEYNVPQLENLKTNEITYLPRILEGSKFLHKDYSAKGCKYDSYFYPSSWALFNEFGIYGCRERLFQYFPQNNSWISKTDIFTGDRNFCFRYNGKLLRGRWDIGYELEIYQFDFISQEWELMHFTYLSTGPFLWFCKDKLVTEKMGIWYSNFSHHISLWKEPNGYPCQDRQPNSLTLFFK